MRRETQKRLETAMARIAVAEIDKALQGEMPLPVRQALIGIKLRKGQEILLNTFLKRDN